MALTSKEFLQRVIEEEPQTFEGGIAQLVLVWLEVGHGSEDSEDGIEEYRRFLLDQMEAVDVLHEQFLRKRKKEK